MKRFWKQPSMAKQLFDIIGALVIWGVEKTRRYLPEGMV